MIYTQEEIKGLHTVSLNMARYFVDFCEEHNLLCYLCGGGCIGALRHEGFIPWDDDLDFFMPRNDYEKLIKLWPIKADNERYPLSNSSKDYLDRNLFVSIRDANTTQIKPYQADLDIPHGVALDVFPLDGYPKGSIQRKKQCIWALIYSLFRAQTVPEKHGNLKKFISSFLLLIVPTQSLRYSIWRLAEKNMSKYKIDECDSITELCAGPGYMKNRYDKAAFDRAVFHKFEGTELPIPIGYDSYLKTAFGNYMELPPLEAQRPHHDVLQLNLEKSYRCK